jgi:hypothetical protein
MSTLWSRFSATSASKPLGNLRSTEAVIITNTEARNLAALDQPIESAPVDSQVICDFESRHYWCGSTRITFVSRGHNGLILL